MFISINGNKIWFIFGISVGYFDVRINYEKYLLIIEFVGIE